MAGGFFDATGNPIANGSFRFKLSSDSVVPPVASYVPTIVTGYLDAQGNLDTTLVFNDQLETMLGFSTFYQLTVNDQKGTQVWNEEYFFAGTDADLTTIQPGILGSNVNPPKNNMDFLDYAVADLTWALSNHLEIAGGGQPIYGYLDPINKRIVYMKGRSGYPTEVNTFDGDNVYQSTTEVSWDPTKPAFKIFASSSWPGANGGIVWAPRQILAGPSAQIVTADSSYRQYSDCSHYVTKNLGGPILTYISGPFSIDLGGDLGTVEVIEQNYFWGASFANLESNLYAKGFGWARWRLSALESGKYVVKQESLFNIIARGGLPVPQFPCPIPVIT